MSSPFSPFRTLAKLLFAFPAITVIQVSADAQNVGIGTNNPSRKFSVAGSVAVDHGNHNYGSLDSAALLFGTGGVGITSKKIGPGGVNGLTLWTGGIQRLNISATGNIGIGGDPSNLYKLRIYGGHVWIDSSVYIQRSLYAYSNSAIGGDIDPAFKFRVYGLSRFTSAQTSGNVTIGGDLDNDYRLRVVGGNSRFGGDMHATGNVAFGGEVDPEYRLRVFGGNSRFGGDMHATGNVAFGGAVDNNFRLRVHNGNSFFGGSVQINDNLSATSVGANTINTINVAVTNSLTIGGKGSVRSNGPSPLRIGFDQKTVDVVIGANGAVTVEADITDFSGDNDDVRVWVSQIKLNPGNTMFTSDININIVDVDATANTCTLRIRNLGGGAATLKATIYLATIAKN